MTEASPPSFPASGWPLFSGQGCKVASLDPDAVAFGWREIALARHEMPGLTALTAPAEGKPLAGLRISGSLHMTIQTAVLMEALEALGADVRWCSCNIFSTQDHAAAAMAMGPPEAGGSESSPAGIPVFAWKGESLEEYWWCLLQALVWPDGGGPNQIVDDGGDATLLIHRGVAHEMSGGDGPDPGAGEEEAVIHRLLAAVRTARGDGFWTALAARVKGVSEETTTGVRRLAEMAAQGTLLFPAVNVNDAVTKSKFDNLYGCRHSLSDALLRATDMLLSGKRAHVAGYGDVGKGCVQSLLGHKARVSVSEVDPICALQAVMEGVTVLTLEAALADHEIFVTATGNKDVITADQMSRMRHLSVVCNIGHFDNEIDMAGLFAMERAGTASCQEIKPQVHLWTFPGSTRGPDGGPHSVLVLSEGRLVNLGNATGHPSLVMSASFSNQLLAQIFLAEGSADGEPAVHLLPKHLDEKVARLHLDRFGATLTKLTPDQALYLGLDPEGPFKPEGYRY
ncbi:adenosylhomocysteinase [bacterium]|nr:adenosylhomocysteinase [bacterium]